MSKNISEFKSFQAALPEEDLAAEAVIVPLEDAVLVPEAPAAEIVLTEKEEKKVEKFVKASIASVKSVDPDSRWRVEYKDSTSLHIGGGVFIRFVDGYAAVRGSQLEAAEAAGAQVVEKL